MKKLICLLLALLCLGTFFTGCSSNNSHNSISKTPSVTIAEAKDALWDEVYEDIQDAYDLDGVS